MTNLLSTILNLPFRLAGGAKNIAIGLFFILGCIALYTYPPVAKKVDKVSEKAADVLPQKVTKTLRNGGERMGLLEPKKGLARRIVAKIKTIPSRTGDIIRNWSSLAANKAIDAILHPFVVLGCVALGLMRYRGVI